MMPIAKYTKKKRNTDIVKIVNRIVVLINNWPSSRLSVSVLSTWAYNNIIVTAQVFSYFFRGFPVTVRGSRDVEREGQGGGS